MASGLAPMLPDVRVRSPNAGPEWALQPRDNAETPCPWALRDGADARADTL